MLDSIIIGAGPAGISAALYLLRAGFSVKVLYRDQGALSKAHKIENYYGFAEPLSGDALAANGMQGAAKLGADFLQTEVMAVTVAETGNHFFVQTAKGDFEARSVVLAAGGRRKAPNIQGLQEFTGKGVSYCAICDGAFYKDKTVVVIGGGNSAIEEAVYLTKFAQKVYIIHRRNELRADKIVQKRAFNNEKIEFILQEIHEIFITLLSSRKFNNIIQNMNTDEDVDERGEIKDLFEDISELIKFYTNVLYEKLNNINYNNKYDTNININFEQYLLIISNLPKIVYSLSFKFSRKLFALLFIKDINKFFSLLKFFATIKIENLAI